MARIVDSIGHTQQKIKWIHDHYADGNLVVDESFQRRFVWNEANRIRLIDSILLGFPIPAIYLWQKETDPESGSAKYSIVDGQQRIRSIMAFLEGGLTLKKAALGKKILPVFSRARTQYEGRDFLNLPNEYKSYFWDFPIDVYSFKPHVDRDSIVATFLRLNSTNLTLNPQELRNAEFNGKLIQTAVEITKDPFWSSKKVFSDDDIRRMLDIQFVSTILMFLRFGVTEDTSQSSINRLYDRFNESYAEATHDKKTFSTLLRICEDIVGGLQTTNEFIQVKSHLYTLILCAYELSKGGTPINAKHRRAFEKFAEAYKDQSRCSPKERKAILEYRLLTTEGTQKKLNRMRRYEIMSDWLKGGIV